MDLTKVPAWLARAWQRAADRDVAPIAVGVLLVLLRWRPPGWLSGVVTAPAVQAATTVFVSVVVQATPFLLLGIVISGVATAYLPRIVVTRGLPRRRLVLAVPVGAAAGALLPACECASIPVAATLVERGLSPPAALAFLLSSPAVNPVVLVATAVAFPHEPALVVARAAASLAAATLMGWVWLWLGPTAWPRGQVGGLAKPSSSRWRTLRSSVVHDFGHTGGFLVLASLGVAVLHVAAPVGGLTAVASHRALSVGVLAVLAVVLAVCSEADAFVAASLTSFSSTARLAFLVVGPMVDVKLIALQAATFGSRFALRFAPATFVVAVASAVAVGTWLL